MSSTTASEAQRAPSTTVRPDEGASDQLVPAKREHDDEVQFISSQPIKKMRHAGHEQGTGAQAAEPSASDHSEGVQPQAEVDPSMPDRSVSAMPLGLPSHLSADPLWENRGSSLPAMESFSFPTAGTPASARPVISAAVSPKQVAQTGPPGGMSATRPLVGPASSPQGMTIDQVSCLDVRGPFESSVTNSAANVSNVNSPQISGNVSTSQLHTMGINSRVSYMPNATFSSLDSFSTDNAAPKSNHLPPGGMAPNSEANMPFAMHPTGNPVSLPHLPEGLPSLSSFVPDMTSTTSNKSPGNGSLPGQQTAWARGSASALGPDWSTASVNPAILQHPRPIRPPQMPLSAVISRLDGTSLRSTAPQGPPCLACMNARQQGHHGPSHSQFQGGHSHGNARTTPSQPAAWPGAFGLQNQAPSSILPRTNANLDTGHGQNDSQVGMQTRPFTSFTSPAYAYHQSPGPGTSGGVQTGAQPQFSHGDFTQTSVSAPAHGHSGTGAHHGYGGLASTMTPIHNAASTPFHTASESSPNRSTFPVPLSTGKQPTLASCVSPNANPRPAQTQPQPQPQVLPTQPRQRAQVSSHQHHQQPAAAIPPPQQAPPASISCATASAASAQQHASARKRHAANLLVDVAELAGEIFPYDAVARQHGTLPRKVAEALAAVVQVPLLRCVTDKRRAGKLGSDRMKEFREARKGWLGLVREWEREDRERERERGRERDAEGETDDERRSVGGSVNRDGGGAAGVGKNGTGAGGGGAREPVDPRAVVQPGEPSALDVALMLPPAEMPRQMLQEGFFTGLW